MPQCAVVFTTHETKQGTSKKGPWALNIFKTADGFSASTLDAGVAQKALGLINQPALITYTERQKDGYTNYSLTAVEAVNIVGAAVTGNAGRVPAAAPAPNPKQETEARITRSFGVNAALKALEIAAAKPQGQINLFDTAEKILQKAVELAYIPAGYAYAGPSRKAPDSVSSPQKAGAGTDEPAPAASEELGIPAAAPVAESATVASAPTI